MKILVKGGRVVDPANNIDAIMDVLIDGPKIAKVAKNINNGADEIIDASQKIILPGLVDMHVHLREPGREDKETIASGTRAAAKGGVTSVLAIPNTEPAVDNPGTIELLKGIIKKTGFINVFVAGTITKARLGKELADIPELKRCGAIAITDDGSSVDDEDLFLEALRQAAEQKIALINHCEDKALTAAGVVNLGFTSTRMGLRGISKESEYKRIERDIRLAERISGSLHIAHVSCAESVEIIRSAKKKGVKITAETAPHYFSLNEEAVLGFDTNMKMNPPLRGKDDIQSIREGLADGTIDVIASDHAPHTENEKEIEFERAEFGVIGLETELAVAITDLIETKILGWGQLAQKLSSNPAKILGVDKGTLGAGSTADIIVVAPDKEWVVKKEEMLSKSKNSPFLGRKLKGLVEYTILGGKIIYEASSHQRAGKVEQVAADSRP